MLYSILDQGFCSKSSQPRNKSKYSYGIANFLMIRLKTYAYLPRTKSHSTQWDFWVNTSDCIVRQRNEKVNRMYSCLPKQSSCALKGKQPRYRFGSGSCCRTSSQQEEKFSLCMCCGWDEETTCRGGSEWLPRVTENDPMKLQFYGSGFS